MFTKYVFYVQLRIKWRRMRLANQCILFLLTFYAASHLFRVVFFAENHNTLAPCGRESFMSKFLSLALLRFLNPAQRNAAPAAFSSQNCSGIEICVGL